MAAGRDTVDEPTVRLEVPDDDRDLSAVRLVSDLPLSDEERAFAREGDTWVLELPGRRLHRLEYLLELDGGTEPDPANPARVAGAFGEKSVWCAEHYAPPWWLDEARHGVPGGLTEVRVRSRAVRSTIRANVWAPEDADPAEGLPLLVVLDGPEFDALGQVVRFCATLIADQELPRHRVALVEPGRRDEWYSASTAWSRALCTELLPAVDERFAPRRTRVGVGASLGGLALLHAQHTHPEAFGGLFLQSSSFFTPEHDAHERGFGRFSRVTRFTRAMGRVREAQARIPVVLTCGAEEENIANNRAMAEALRAQGYDVDLVELGDLHNYTAWRDAFDPHLTDLLARVWS